MKTLNRRGSLLTIVLSLVLVISSLNTSLALADNENIVAAEGITLTIDFGNGTIISFENLNGSSVLEVTSSVLNVEVQWHGSLAYIQGIEGLVAVGASGWEYWVNGEFASTAVNLYLLEDGDTLLWKYTRPEPQSQYDPSFIPGMIFVSLSGVGFIAIVYVQTSRRIK